jgi:H+/Na+-translocating ferredoxin:NAD+ oxidoreductase subunit G
MGEMIKMVVVLTLLSVISGGTLSFLQKNTTSLIEDNKLQFVKGPAIKTILGETSNNPVSDRFTIAQGDKKDIFFVGKYKGDPKTVAFETFGKGFGGDVYVVLGVDLATDKLTGVRVTTMNETPGVGARAKTDLTFVSQFKGETLQGTFKVKADGGQVDAMAGATITSRAVSAALTDASKIYHEYKPQIVEKAKALKK